MKSWLFAGGDSKSSSSKSFAGVSNLNVKLPLIAGGLFVFGVLVFGGYQLIKQVRNSRANHFPLPFSDVGNADWCSSSLQSNLNTSLFTDQLGSDINYLTTYDCGDKVSLISQADWLSYSNTYQSTLQTNLGATGYLPNGVTTAWTTTDVGDPDGKQVFQIDQSGSTSPADSDTLSDFIPTVRLASTTACVTGAGTTSDPYVLADSSLCNPPPTPVPTSTPTPPTSTSVPTPTPTTNCGSGYYLADGSCLPNCNLAACTSCSSPNYCNKCEEGYTLDSGRCRPQCNIANCSSCSAPDYCSSCLPGFINVSGACQPSSTPVVRPSAPPTRPPAAPTPPAPTLVPTPTPPIVVVATNLDDAGSGEGSSNFWFAHLGNDGFVPDLYSFAKLAGISDVAINSLVNIFNYLILPTLIFLGLPLALLLAFFPLPRGKAQPSAIITVRQNNFPVASRIANSGGNYWGFHLLEAEYLLQASKVENNYPSSLTLANNAYHHNLYPDFAESSKQMSFLNHLANSAPIVFIITLILALVYLTLPGILAVLAHLPWMVRRVMLGTQTRGPNAKDDPVPVPPETNNYD